MSLEILYNESVFDKPVLILSRPLHVNVPMLKIHQPDNKLEAGGK